MIIVVFGLPGSGKSYFAKQLAKRLNAVYISSDQVRKTRFANLNYTLAEKKLVYGKMILLGKKALSTGKMIIMDGTFYLKSLRKMITDEFENQRIHFIEVTASDSLIKERTSKKRAFSDADFRVHKKIKRVFQPMKTPHLTLTSTNDNLDEMLNKADDHIKLNQTS